MMKVSTEKSTSPPAPSEEVELSIFEDLLKVVGTNGPGHFIIYAMCFLGAWLTTLHVYNYQFLGATPDHWCHVEELFQANWTDDQIKALSIPYLPEKDEFSKCTVYNYNYSHAAMIGFEKSLNNQEVQNGNKGDVLNCQKRHFVDGPPTLVTEWDLVCERRYLLSSTQSALQFGKLISSLSWGITLDMFGRRKVATISGSVYAIVGMVMSLAPSIYFFIAGRVLLGILDFTIYTASFIIAMEYCLESDRMKINMLVIGLGWASGYMSSAGIAYFIRPWHLLQLAMSAPAAAYILFIWFFPESPRWLITQGRFKEAKDILTSIASSNKKTMPSDDRVYALMGKIKGGNESWEKSKASLCLRMNDTVKNYSMPLVDRNIRLRSLCIFYIWIAVSMVYYGITFWSPNISTNPYLFMFFGALLEVPSYVLMWPTCDYFGRKKVLICCFSVTFSAIFIVMVLMLLYTNVPAAALWILSLSGKFAVTSAFQLMWIYTGELYPTNIRSTVVGEGSLLARVGAMISPYIIDIVGEKTNWAPAAIFVAVSLAAIGACLPLQETKNAALPDAMKDVHAFVNEAHFSTKNKPNNDTEAP